MRMSRQSLLAYDRLVGAAGNRAATAYERLLSAWLSNNPQATENEIIDAAAYFACTTLNTYGEAAATAADELCRQLAAQDKISGTTHTDYAPDRKEIGKILGSQKSREPIAQGDKVKFVTVSSDRVKDECHRAANKQMLKSAKALGCKRYARVPVGDSKTCKFCVSVAANGFHGLTEEGAKKLTRLHDNCRCKVIPGFGKNHSVEGYDPKEYKEAYELRKKLEQEGYSVAQIQRAMAGEPIESLGAPNSGKGGRPKKLTPEQFVSKLPKNAHHLPKAIRALVGTQTKLFDGDLTMIDQLFPDPSNVTKEQKEMILEGLRYLPSRYVEQRLFKGLWVVFTDPAKVVNPRPSYDNGSIQLYTGIDDEFSFIHEFVHGIDDANPSFRQKSRDFLKQRGEGCSKKRISELTGTTSYEKDEIAYDVGKTYDPYAYKIYGYDAYETSTVGIQALYQDPFGLLKKDPKLFAHAFRQLTS